MSYILEALKKLESQKVRVTLKRPTRTKDSQEERWFKRPRFALTLTAILALGISVGLFLFLHTKEGADSKQLVFEKPKTPKPVLQAKADIKPPEITPASRPAIKDKTDTKEEKIPDSSASQSKKITYGYKDKIELEIPMPF